VSAMDNSKKNEDDEWLKQFVIAPPTSDTLDDVATVGEPKTARRKRRKKRRITPLFITLPRAWAVALAGAKLEAAHIVAVWLLEEQFVEEQEQEWGWRPYTPEIWLTIANGRLEEERGVSRWQKCRGLRRLEELDLIETDRRPRKSPRVRLKHLPKRKRRH
jgi:hypothetical protein